MTLKSTPPLDQVTRFEMIDKNGRRLVLWDQSIKLTLSLQDDGRTLKVFVDSDVSALLEAALLRS